MRDAKTLEAIIGMLVEIGMASYPSVIGCSESEIANVEKSFDLKLPAPYREFLVKMGKEAGDFGGDSIMFYPGIMLHRSDAERIAKRKSFDLKRSHFVFYTCEDMFLFFDCDDNDPAVYRLDEADKAPNLVANSFMEFLTDYVTSEVELAKSS